MLAPTEEGPSVRWNAQKETSMNPPLGRKHRAQQRHEVWIQMVLQMVLVSRIDSLAAWNS